MARGPKNTWHQSKPVWTKSWNWWWTKQEHISLTYAALGIGCGLLNLANSGGRQSDGSAWCLNHRGAPMTPADIARYVHAPTQTVVLAIDDLIAAGSLVRREDGAVGFPEMQKWQEDPSTQRKRKKKPTLREIPREIPRERPA